MADMQLTSDQTGMRTSGEAGDGKDLPHLSGPAAAIRQVLAAHFVRDCPHVLEIGGHLRPVTPHLTHRPASVLVVDPKSVPYECDTLNGHACHVRHVAAKFQTLAYDYAPFSYGLVLLGYSLKPYGEHQPLGALLFGLIDHARVIVIDYPPALDRATSQVPDIIDRATLRRVCAFDLVLQDDAIASSPFAKRHFIVLEPLAAARRGGA